jgi:cellulose synthase/poly-beta-1,6-N-acetylglucosamine synthase-like glycosyltransferase
MLAIRILENLLILYFGFYLMVELVLVLVFFRIWRRLPDSIPQPDLNPEYGITILVPAHNEAVTIADCVRLLLQTDYPNFEVIVINDGSSDNTLEQLQAAFHLEGIPCVWNDRLGAQEPRALFGSPIDSRLRVVDKPRGGKADALNAGLNFSRHQFICTLDADSILDAQALHQVIAPFRGLNGQKIVATGGALAVANGSRVTSNRFETEALPRNLWVLFQLIEYLRSFVVSRTALSRIGGLLIMSGAFTLFRRQVLLEAGGFLSPFNRHPYVQRVCRANMQTVCEDIEVVVRIRRFLREQGQPARIVYLPRPICWTEVPDQSVNLSRQRDRWHRGLLETLAMHRHLFFEPRYGTLGLVAMPYYLIFEASAPLVRVFTYTFVAFLLFTGLVNQGWLLMMMLTISLISALVMGLVTVRVERWSRNSSPVNLAALRYRSGLDWFWLLGLSILSDFTYAQIRLWWQLKGSWHFLRGNKSWGKFERKGFHA